MATQRYFHLHLVSDATGETLIVVGRAVASQYKQTHAIEHIHSLVRTQAHVERAGASRVQIAAASVEGKAMGLRTDSSLVLDKLAVVEDRFVIKQIGTCPPHTMLLVDDALRKVFDL